jgi:hypothetical protein
MAGLPVVAPAFIEMAHRIVWCTAASTGTGGRPRTRILHPIWEFDGTSLTGYIATSPRSPKKADLDARPYLSLTYWTPNHDTCTADCDVAWTLDEESRRAGWDRFVHAPHPVAYDPSIIPGWTDPMAADFGILRLSPYRLRVMPGTMMTAGAGTVLTWRR